MLIDAFYSSKRLFLLLIFLRGATYKYPKRCINSDRCHVTERNSNTFVAILRLLKIQKPFYIIPSC